LFGCDGEGKYPTLIGVLLPASHQFVGRHFIGCSTAHPRIINYSNHDDDDNNNNNNNNSLLLFFIIYVPSQQPQGQLQAQHSVDTDNYIMNKHNIKSKTS
jgi:hypothetical protein